MAYRPASQGHAHTGHAHPGYAHSGHVQTGRGYAPHARTAQAAAAERPNPWYTLTHGGRQIRLGPVAFWIAVGTLVVMAVWTITTATYFAFRDDVLTRLIARQADMQFGYEDRIAELRAQIDRISSRQLLDQDQYDHKLEQIMRRQTMLESRASALNALPDPAPTGSVRHPGQPMRGSMIKPSPMNDKGLPPIVSDRETRFDPRQPRHGARVAAGAEGALLRLQTSLDRIETRQVAALNAAEQGYEAKARQIRSVLADLKLGPAKLEGAATGATGGPFVPAPLTPDAGGFERHMMRVKLARNQLDRLQRTLVSVPVRKPLLGELDLSSGFGTRLDPFIRAPAMHTGLDLRGDTGDPVRVTANGTVTHAGWSGGYGKMVEVDHGNGFATRYGHLSAFDVRVGQTVKVGQIVGRIGTTGRSTGPHLHYETRIDGEPVDPQKFLRAGGRLAGAL